MQINNSPWIKQLKRTRPIIPIEKDESTEVLVVGGGIAGIVTSYFILKNTDKKIILLEAGKVAHGATGHNAGQTTTYFERPLHDIAKEFGAKLAAEGQAAVESGWDLLDDMYSEASLQTPLYRFAGYAGCSSIDQLKVHLEDNLVRVQNNIPKENIFIASDLHLDDESKERYKGLYDIVPKKDLLEMLETSNEKYNACVSYQKGCMNSALFTEELLGYLMSKFASRFSFYENSPVTKVVLENGRGYAQVLDAKVDFKNVILCTNGFENFDIENQHGDEINTEFHHDITGRIGYMQGFIEKSNLAPAAISYFGEVADEADPTGDSYYYLTRRPGTEEGEHDSLLCVGGPDRALPNGANYTSGEIYPEGIEIEIQDFLQNNYKGYSEEKIKPEFFWHGLMGFTPNMIRRVGAEPCNPVLLYNLGCNGVGILPSIYGGKRISQILSGEKLDKSIFDPVDQRLIK